LHGAPWQTLMDPYRSQGHSCWPTDATRLVRAAHRSEFTAGRLLDCAAHQPTARWWTAERFKVRLRRLTFVSGWIGRTWRRRRRGYPRRRLSPVQRSRRRNGPDAQRARFRRRPGGYADPTGNSDGPGPPILRGTEGIMRKPLQGGFEAERSRRRQGWPLASKPLR